MKLKSGFLLRQINNTWFLVPYGQRVYEFYRALSLNEMSLHIIEKLRHSITMDSLEADLYEFLEANTDDERKQVYTDLVEFIQYLHVNRYLLDDNKIQRTLIHRLSIAGININISSDDGSLFCEQFADFTRADGKHDLSIYYITTGVNKPIGEKFIMSTPDLEIYESEGEYMIFPRSTKYVSLIVLNKDGKKSGIYHDWVTDTDLLKEELYLATRFSFFYSAGIRNMYAIHSSSILYKEKAILFTGPSGTGKSTHASIWQKLYDVSVINGDVNVVEIIDGKPIVHGTPWCGTSGIYTTKDYPLGAIVRLEKYPKNICKKQELTNSALVIYQRIISGTWSDLLMNRAIDFAELLAAQIPVYELKCNMEDEAAETIKSEIDKL